MLTTRFVQNDPKAGYGPACNITCLKEAQLCGHCRQAGEKPFLFTSKGMHAHQTSLESKKRCKCLRPCTNLPNALLNVTERPKDANITYMSLLQMKNNFGSLFIGNDFHTPAEIGVLVTHCEDEVQKTNQVPMRQETWEVYVAKLKIDLDLEQSRSLKLDTDNGSACDAEYYYGRKMHNLIVERQMADVEKGYVIFFV